MRRIQFFEFPDLPWFPQLLRDAETAYLTRAVSLTGDARRFAPKVKEVLAKTGCDRIVDLCSGAAGPVVQVAQELVRERQVVGVTVTDLRPNVPALALAVSKGGGAIIAAAQPVDATAVPNELRGLRTVFNAFHHFDPVLAQRVLADAVRARQPIAIFELVERSPAAFLGMLLAPILSLFLVPTLRPFRWAWLPLTYLLPVIPFLIAFDGIVSCLRIYSPAELRQLVESLGATDYTWDIGQIQMTGPIKGTYLVGYPMPFSPTQA